MLPFAFFLAIGIGRVDVMPLYGRSVHGEGEGVLAASRFSIVRLLGRTSQSQHGAAPSFFANGEAFDLAKSNGRYKTKCCPLAVSMESSNERPSGSVSHLAVKRIKRTGTHPSAYVEVASGPSCSGHGKIVFAPPYKPFPSPLTVGLEPHG